MPEATGICFCGNDTDDSDKQDAHAHQIRDVILSIKPTWKVVIATVNQENSSTLIEGFRDGDGDVLVVKQMASLGLDVEFLKVLADLSATRTSASFIQRITRVCTKTKNAEVADYITPDDSISRALYGNFIEGVGGGIQVEIDSDLLYEYVKDREELLPPSPVVIGRVVSTGDVNVTDSDNMKHFSSGGDVSSANLLLAYPKLANFMSVPEIAKLASEWLPTQVALPSATPVVEVVDIFARCAELRSQIEDATKRAAWRKYNFHTDSDSWVEEKKRVQNAAKRKCGIATSTSVANIYDIDVLNKLLEATNVFLNGL